MYAPLARSYTTFSLVDGGVKDNFGTTIPTYFEITNDAGTDADIYLGGNPTSIKVAAGTSRYIFVRSGIITAKGAAVTVTAYFV